MSRNKILIFMLVMAGAIWLSGCSANTQRNSLNVEKALIGHWANTNGSSDYYFSDTGFTKVEKDGSTTNMTYIVVKLNDSENTITIRVSKPAGLLQDEETRDIKFSADKKSMTETVNILGIKTGENSFSYTDSKTKP
jgi:hypothetical protein